MDALGLDRRRLGTGLFAFGLTGMLLAGIIAAALIGGAFAARNLDDRLVADQERIAAALTRLTVSMESLAITSGNAGTTLQTTSDTVAKAQDVLSDVAATSAELSTAMDISILGNKPFAGAADKMGQLALTIQGFEEQAGKLALALETNAGDAAAVAEQIRVLKGQVGELAVIVADFDRLDQVVTLLLGGIVVGGLLTTWIAVGAAFCAWVGWKLRTAATGAGVASGGAVPGA